MRTLRERDLYPYDSTGPGNTPFIRFVRIIRIVRTGLPVSGARREDEF